jgi:hypothetical protein
MQRKIKILNAPRIYRLKKGEILTVLGFYPLITQREPWFFQGSRW